MPVRTDEGGDDPGGADPGGADTELLARLRAGDRDALAEAYRHWAALVHTVALRSLGNHHDAEDVTQQVFLSAWRSRERLQQGRGSLAGWLVTITRRRCADLHARRERDRRDASALAEVATQVGYAYDDQVTNRLVVTHELARMDDPRGTILRMALVEERSQPDIACQLDLPLGTVKSHVRRGLLQLRRRLEEVTA